MSKQFTAVRTAWLGSPIIIVCQLSGEVPKLAKACTTGVPNTPYSPLIATFPLLHSAVEVATKSSGGIEDLFPSTE